MKRRVRAKKTTKQGEGNYKNQKPDKLENLWAKKK